VAKRDEVIHELRLLRDYLHSMDIEHRIKLDTSLVRGLDYYTGMIFEAVITGGEEAKLGLGSIAAGGRYDNLIGMFSKNQIPSAGGSLGIERIFNILE
jgi:histidyl-tRNA synthetase